MPEKEPQLKQPLVGEARELNKLASEKWQEHLLLFSQVKNEVLFVNPEVYAPLQLKEGESSPLGLFVEAAFQQKPTELSEGKQALEFWPEHERSIILGRVIFGDKEGRAYRDIDLKGVGYFYEESMGSAQIANPKRIHEKHWGLLDGHIAFYDYFMTEQFLKAGIRTARVLGIIKLKEIIADSKKISIEEAIKSGVIDKDFQPVAEIRAYATKLRIGDFRDSGNQVILRDAKKIIAQELGLKEPLPNSDYAEWFTKTLGRNVGLMHKNGWFHNYLFPHNVTLDCRIVDLDGVSQLNSEKERLRDVDDAWNTLLVLFESLHCDYAAIHHVRSQFMKNYDAAFPPKAHKEYFKIKKN